MEKPTIRVLTYNIHKGFTSGNRRFVLKRMREAIRAANADLVFLQEVLGNHDEHSKNLEEWPAEPQFEFLADSIWPHFAYGRNAVYTTGHHGNAILSKYPLSFWENIDISTNRLERRGLLHGVIEIPHQPKPLHAICVHLGLVENERQSQIDWICQRIQKLIPEDEPVIIGGDFNDWRSRVSHPLEKKVQVREVFRTLQGRYARTFPSWMPTLKLDRIYFRNVHPIEAGTFSGKPWTQLSDHLALFAEFQIESTPG